MKKTLVTELSVYCKISSARDSNLAGLPQVLKLCCVPAVDYICTDSYGQNEISFLGFFGSSPSGINRLISPLCVQANEGTINCILYII